MSDDVRARLERWSKLGKSTTPGPWQFLVEDGCCWLVDMEGMPILSCDLMGRVEHVEDEGLLAAAPALPALAAYALRAMAFADTLERDMVCGPACTDKVGMEGHAPDCELAALLHGPDLPV